MVVSEKNGFKKYSRIFFNVISIPSICFEKQNKQTNNENLFTSNCKKYRSLSAVIGAVHKPLGETLTVECKSLCPNRPLWFTGGGEKNPLVLYLDYTI